METMQFHIIKMNFIFEDNILAFKWSNGTHWHAQEIVLSVQCRDNYPSYPLGTRCSNGFLTQFLKISLIFMNMQMR